MNHSVRRLSLCAARASSRAARSPPLRTPRALPRPPSGATVAPSATTGRAGASACPYARGGTTHPSAVRPPGTARTRSRRSGPWPPRRGRPAPLASVSPFAPRPAALAGPSEVGRAVQQGPRRCSAPRHRAALVAPCQPAAPPRLAAGPRVRPRSPAFAPQPHDPPPAVLAAATPSPASPCGSSALVHPWRPFPAGLDTTRITSARVASNHVRVRKFADRYDTLVDVERLRFADHTVDLREATGARAILS